MKRLSEKKLGELYERCERGIDNTPQGALYFPCRDIMSMIEEIALLRSDEE